MLLHLIHLILHLVTGGIHAAYTIYDKALDEENTYTSHAARMEEVAARSREVNDRSELPQRCHIHQRYPRQQPPCNATARERLVPLHEEEQECETMEAPPPRRSLVKKIHRRLKATCLCCASRNNDDDEDPIVLLAASNRDD